VGTEDVALNNIGFAFGKKKLTEEEIAIQKGIDATMREVCADCYRPTDRDSGPGPSAPTKPRVQGLENALLIIPANRIDPGAKAAPKPKAEPDGGG
jgi:hypothetical protein